MNLYIAKVTKKNGMEKTICITECFYQFLLEGTQLYRVKHGDEMIEIPIDEFKKKEN